LAAAIVFSTFNAITLSPTLASLILRPPNATPDPIDRIFRFLFGWFFDLFNRIFGWIERRYGQFIEALTRIKPMIMIIFAAGLVATVFMYQVVPSGFIPEEDQGYFFVLGNSPSNTSLNYSRQQVADVGRVLEEMPEMQAFLGIAGNVSRAITTINIFSLLVSNPGRNVPVRINRFSLC
jgi:multidrug efflux pump subunit AcrB